MPNVLYLGNKFFEFKKVKSVLETLEPLLGEFCQLKTASGKKNQFLRFMDMLIHFFRYGLKADLIIIDVYSTLAFWFAFTFGMLSRLFGKKYALFLHGGNLPARHQKMPALLRTFFQPASHIIAPSTYLRDYFQEQGYTVTLIPNIISLDEYPFLQRNAARPRLLALRGFGKPYNPLMTLQAIHRLKEQVPDLQATLLGNPEDYFYPQVQELIASLGLQNTVSVRSKMPKADWIELSKDFDIMISNPWIDNTPVSLLEGMALGMCVISTRVGGVPKLFSEEECMFVESDDAQALADAIQTLLDSPKRVQAMSLNGRAKAATFDWEKIKWKWEKILSFQS